MARKTKKKKRTAKRRIKPSKLRFLWPLFLTLLVTATLGATAYFIFLTPGTVQVTKTGKIAPPLPKGANRPVYQPPKAEIAYEEDSLPEVKKKPVRKKVIATNGSKPQLAILIDDMGNRQKLGQQLIDLDITLSFAILPFTPHAHSLMEMAHAKGREILLHLPMEATLAKWDPGPGALYTSMSARSIKAQVRKDLEDLPYAIGVNNHMGSKFTSDKKAMQAALAPIKARDLFFLDSITIAKSVAYDEAKKMGIKTARRDVFIDNEQDAVKIKSQLERVVKIAKKHGSAIGIAHPHPITIATLKKEKAWLQEQVELVPISTLME